MISSPAVFVPARSLLSSGRRRQAAHGLAALALAAGLLPWSAAAQAPAAVPAPRTVLVLAGTGEKVAPAVVENLKQEGMTLVTRPIGEPLSQELLHQFHAVLLLDFAGLGMPLFHDAGAGGYISQHFTLKRNLAELRQYVENGGGLFVSPFVTGGGLQTCEQIGALLAPWGAEVLAANARDDARTWTSYAWTTNVAAHPVTAGVKTFFYPIEMGRWDDAYPTTPLALKDPRWQPVLRSMPESIVAQCLQYKDWFPLPGAPKPPVLAAVAEIGKGRVAVLAVNCFYTFMYPYADLKSGSVGEFHTGNINGVVLEKGDGKTASDGRRLIANTLHWLTDGAAAQGLGAYTPEVYAKAPVPPKAAVPAWLTGWNEGNGATWHKVLIGARSSFSRGTGTIAEWGAAARQAGYAVLVMTEDLDAFTPARWPEFVAACRDASGADLVVLPGLDMADTYGNRLLLFGQPVFPKPWMLTPDGKAMRQVQYLMLGFGTCFSAIAHPTTSPLPQEMFKFFSGVVAYTYDRDGKLIDDGLQTYQAQIYNTSCPIPLTVHELDAPAQVAVAAVAGHQLYVPGDNVENAAWYMRDGMSHFWETPVKFLVTSGPMIKTFGGVCSITADAPITDVRFYNQYELARRWTPNTPTFTAEYALWPGNLRLGFFWVADAKGRTAITPGLRLGNGHGYNYRCSDRQNFFTVAVNYQGTVLGDGIDIWLPTFGTDEGRGLWPHSADTRRGENICPLLHFPFYSQAMSVTEAILDQRYWRANWLDVAYDGKPPQGTSRARIYEGRVRFHDLHYAPFGQRGNAIVPLMLMDIELRLRQPVCPEGESYPRFVTVAAQPDCTVQDAAGAWVSRKVTQGWLDLPVGGQAADLVALTPGLRVNAQGQIGWANTDTDNGPLPVGTTWQARWVRLDPQKDAARQRQAMGLAGPTPFALKLTRGKLGQVQYVAGLTAENGGVAGEIAPWAEMPFNLPLCIAGLNTNWPTAVWRPGAKEDMVPFGVFERQGWARLDVTTGGAFYAGNLVTCDQPSLRIGLLDWTKDGIGLELNNPTGTVMETVLRTPPEIRNRFTLEARVRILPGTSVRLRFPQGK